MTSQRNAVIPHDHHLPPVSLTADTLLQNHRDASCFNKIAARQIAGDQWQIESLENSQCNPVERHRPMHLMATAAMKDRNLLGERHSAYVTS